MRIYMLRWLLKLTFVIGVIAICVGVCGTFTYGYAQDTIAPNQVREIAWSPNADKVAVSYHNGQIMIGSVSGENASLSLQGHASAVAALAWSPDGNYLASGGLYPDDTLRIWDASTGQEIFAQPDVGVGILSVGWNPNGNQVIAITAEGLTSAGNAVVVDMTTGQAAPMSFGVVSDIEWSPDGTKVAFGTIGSISIRDAANFQSLFNSSLISREIFRSGLQNQLVRIAWSPDGTRIAGGMGDGRVFLWELDNPEPIATFIGNDYQGDDRFIGWIYDLHFDNNGQMLTSVSGDGTIRTWNLQDGSLIMEQTTSPNYAAEFSPYGARVALGLALEADSVNIQANTAELVQTLAGGAVQIVVPAPSLERLQAIADACNPPASVEQSLTANLQADQLSDFVAQVEALPAETIPPACAADLIAVAQALQSQ